MLSPRKLPPISGKEGNSQKLDYLHALRQPTKQKDMMALLANFCSIISSEMEPEDLAATVMNDLQDRHRYSKFGKTYKIKWPQHIIFNFILPVRFRICFLHLEVFRRHFPREWQLAKLGTSLIDSKIINR